MLKRLFLRFILSIAFVLMAINIYGLFQDIRPETINNEYLRFINDQPASYEATINALIKKDNEGDIAFSHRATWVISKGLAHIHWEKYPAEKFNQLVPIWENYFLYFMGKFSNIPEYKKYHFADYKRSLKRGIGICGDASMILSQVLTKNNIHNNILTYPGHVVVSANYKNGTSQILDADFGVTVPFDKNNTAANHINIAQLYSDKGYSINDEIFFQRMYKSDFQTWRDVKHFITNKYYFEKVSYWLKWSFPVFLFLFSIYFLIIKKKNYDH